MGSTAISPALRDGRPPRSPSTRHATGTRRASPSRRYMRSLCSAFSTTPARAAGRPVGWPRRSWTAAGTILSVDCTLLAEIGEYYKRPNADVVVLYEWAARFRSGVIETADERTGAARDFDVRAGRSIVTETVAQFAPLLCGGLPHDKERT